MLKLVRPVGGKICRAREKLTAPTLSERVVSMPGQTLSVPADWYASKKLWCRRRDLNPHGLRHTPLKRACLPFHHFGKNVSFVGVRREPCARRILY